MYDAAESPRDEEMLGQLAELDLALAKAVYSRTIAAEDSDEMAALGRTYQRLARSLRQTIALRDRLIRQRRQEARETPPPRDEGRIERRRAELRSAVRRVIWNETERERQDDLCDLLEARLDQARLPDDWGRQPLDQHVSELCAALDLPPGAVARWRELGDIGCADAQDHDGPGRRSSA